MARELPYFKFFCSEWTDGDITLEDYRIQGLFINVCSYYWSNNCDISLVKLKKKFKQETETIDYLIKENLIKVNDEYIVISFLDEQLDERLEVSKIKSKGGKASAEARRLKKLEQENNRKSTESQHVLNSCSTETQLLREDKIREDKRREDNKINILCVSFIPFFNDVDFQEVWIDFEKVRIRKKASKSERTYKSLMKKILEFSGGKKDLAIKIVANSADSGWTDLYRLKEEKINNQKKQSNFSKVVEANKERSWNKNN